ncbi:hypothetical protein CI610_03271 [invertebrate metagenome]|uniref:Outer membrane protein beta-barrel domain-containing protein n=1 Tax=invertebrate metagenome TaxID=1711999 RepID=A0A2H9T3M4_9ZZZZ
MNKFLAASAVCALSVATAVPAFADANQESDGNYASSSNAGRMFFGVEAGKTTVSSSLKVDDKTWSDGEETANQYGVRMGAYLSDYVRMYVNVNQLKNDEDYKDDELTSRDVTLSADYLFETGLPIRPFIGITAGGNYLEYDDDSQWAAVYGGQAGFLVQVGNFDIDAGYRYLKSDQEVGKHAAKVTVDDTQTPYVSVSYKF